MKKKMFLFGYVGVLLLTASLQSCQDDPITPTDCTGNCTDTTWVDDTTNNGGGNPIDSTYCTPDDSTDYNGGNDNGGGTDPSDSTDWNPYDSTYIGG